MAVAVQLYTTTYCPHCVRAKMLLKRKNIAFDEIDVTHDPEKRAWLVQVTGRRTVPQIFIHDEPIGGSAELHAMERLGELDTRVRQRQASEQPPSSCHKSAIPSLVDALRVQ